MACADQQSFKVTRENWLEDHPKFKEVQSFGYFNEKSSLARAVITVYLDLCENKHWFGVCIRPCESLKLVYITGKRTKKSQVDVVVPLTIDTVLTVEEIQDIVKEVNRCEQEGEDAEMESSCASSRVTVAFCEADSTVVYYDFFQGLVPPDPPDEEEEKEEQVKSVCKKVRQKKEKTHLNLTD